jgi:c-di-GMP-related signal transduction protein
MGINIQKYNNLEKLLDGISLLEEQDQERIIRVVDTLNLTDKKVKEEIFKCKIKREQGAICERK